MEHYPPLTNRRGINLLKTLRRTASGMQLDMKILYFVVFYPQIFHYQSDATKSEIITEMGIILNQIHGSMNTIHVYRIWMLPYVEFVRHCLQTFHNAEILPMPLDFTIMSKIYRNPNVNLPTDDQVLKMVWDLAALPHTSILPE
jgi:hypothetical protein